MPQQPHSRGPVRFRHLLHLPERMCHEEGDQARRDEEQGHPNAAGEESIAEAWPVPGPQRTQYPLN